MPPIPTLRKRHSERAAIERKISKFDAIDKMIQTNPRSYIDLPPEFTARDTPRNRRIAMAAVTADWTVYTFVSLRDPFRLSKPATAWAWTLAETALKASNGRAIHDVPNTIFIESTWSFFPHIANMAHNILIAWISHFSAIHFQSIAADLAERDERHTLMLCARRRPELIEFIPERYSLDSDFIWDCVHSCPSNYMTIADHIKIAADPQRDIAMHVVMESPHLYKYVPHEIRADNTWQSVVVMAIVATLHGLYKDVPRAVQCSTWRQQELTDVDWIPRS